MTLEKELNSVIKTNIFCYSEKIPQGTGFYFWFGAFQGIFYLPLLALSIFVFFQYSPKDILWKITLAVIVIQLLGILYIAAKLLSTVDDTLKRLEYKKKNRKKINKC